MLPTSSEGNTSTFACPAISLPGALLAPTAGTIAASVCNSPSIFREGSISLASRVASTTLSTISWLALPFDEKLNMAIRGSMLAISRAVFAVDTAIWASSEAVGLGNTAQSAKTINPSSPYERSGTNMRNAPETTFTPGAVLII